MLNGLCQEDPANVAYKVELGQTYHELGYLLWSRGRWTEAETAYRQALAVQQPLAARLGPSASESVTDVANTLNSLGILLASTNGSRRRSRRSARPERIEQTPARPVAVSVTRQQSACAATGIWPSYWGKLADSPKQMVVRLCCKFGRWQRPMPRT